MPVTFGLLVRPDARPQPNLLRGDRQIPALRADQAAHGRELTACPATASTTASTRGGARGGAPLREYSRGRRGGELVEGIPGEQMIEMQLPWMEH